MRLAAALTPCGAKPPPAWPGDDELVVCVDTMVEGVHFPEDTAPAALAYKLFAVNLSDLAAMGAEPSYALLSICTGQCDDIWLDAFAAGARAASEHFATPIRSLEVAAGPLLVSAQVHGHVPRGTALLRSGARVGDLVYVTGTLGDAAAALAAWRGELSPPAEAGAWLRARLDRPTPRLGAASRLRHLASACIDISDGLCADLGHILTASDVGARIQIEHLPVSASLLRSVPRERALEFALAGGDDYELLFCLPPRHQAALAARTPYLECALRCIGVVEKAPGLRCFDAEGVERQPRAGWMHFDETDA